MHTCLREEGGRALGEVGVTKADLENGCPAVHPPSVEKTDQSGGETALAVIQAWQCVDLSVCN